MLLIRFNLRVLKWPIINLHIGCSRHTPMLKFNRIFILIYEIKSNRHPVIIFKIIIRILASFSSVLEVISNLSYFIPVIIKTYQVQS